MRERERSEREILRSCTTVQGTNLDTNAAFFGETETNSRLLLILGNEDCVPTLLKANQTGVFVSVLVEKSIG